MSNPATTLPPGCAWLKELPRAASRNVRMCAGLPRISVNPEGLRRISFRRLLARKSWFSRRCWRVGWMRQASSRSWCRACSGRRSKRGQQGLDLMGLARVAPGRQRVRGATGDGAPVLKTQWLPFFSAEAGLEVEQEFPDPLGRKRRRLAAGLLGVGFRRFHIAFSFGAELAWSARAHPVACGAQLARDQAEKACSPVTWCSKWTSRNS